jgi:hypothetical protein
VRDSQSIENSRSLSYAIELSLSHLKGACHSAAYDLFISSAPVPIPILQIIRAMSPSSHFPIYAVPILDEGAFLRSLDDSRDRRNIYGRKRETRRREVDIPIQSSDVQQSRDWKGTSWYSGKPILATGARK